MDVICIEIRERRSIVHETTLVKHSGMKSRDSKDKREREMANVHLPIHIPDHLRKTFAPGKIQNPTKSRFCRLAHWHDMREMRKGQADTYCSQKQIVMTRTAGNDRMLVLMIVARFGKLGKSLIAKTPVESAGGTSWMQDWQSRLTPFETKSNPR
jgi:hypothetical protein